MWKITHFTGIQFFVELARGPLWDFDRIHWLSCGVNFRRKSRSHIHRANYINASPVPHEDSLKCDHRWWSNGDTLLERRHDLRVRYRFAIDPEHELLRNESDGRHVWAHTRISDSLPARHCYRGCAHTYKPYVSRSRTSLRENVDHPRTWKSGSCLP